MTRPRDARWPGPLALLSEVRRTPGVTRAEAARRLGLGSGSATDIAARLRALDLLDEVPAPAAGRGRPTTQLLPHPRGPLVAVVEVRYEGWRCALAGIDGRPSTVAAGRHAHGAEQQVVREIADTLRDLKQRHGHRLRAVSVSVAAAVRHRHLVRPTTLGWDPTDLSGILPDATTPLVIGNDATLAGLAEARGGAGLGAGTVLHLTVEVGLGGVLVIDGVPAVGGSGTGGEYGHMPFGDRSRRCPCGARGCWDNEVDGRALARHLGAAPPDDPRAFALDVLQRAEHDAEAAEAVRTVADALASGIAGLVNAHDPDVVTLGGLAPLIRNAAQPDFDTAYLNGLMEFRRADPIPLRAASLGDDGALIGAAAAGLDVVLSESGLDDWAADLERPATTGSGR
ncbi:ROK family transcriptional regulator [Catenulispora rubra]|uniref:ROK family transcriptional regulator n=1 Tax=Catenulispora rubra TaxID=280293 RepID=UPI0018923038|nr:ROK family transcriptional regulator [Catenulispora rubra]